MAGPGLPLLPPGPGLVLAVLLLLLPPALAPARCLPHQFQCEPGGPCFHREWICDGHPDCPDERDEQDCGTATPAEPSPGGPGLSPPWSSAEPAAAPEPGVSVPSRSQGDTWILAVAGLLSILVAAGSAAVWGLSKAKRRSNTFSPEKASREQLMPAKSQPASFA